MSISEVSVSGIPVNAFKNMEDALSHIVDDSGNVMRGSAIAINPEKVMRARSERVVYQTLMNATIRYVDGMGVKYVVEKKTGTPISRIPGCELWEALMGTAAQWQLPVYILGASTEVNGETIRKLRALNVKVVGHSDGYFSDEDTVIADIKSSRASIVTVAMGSPKQELLIDKLRQAHPEAFYMGVGGTYDVFTHHVKRAPKFWCNMGLEWFYRLLSQPSRIFRQKNLLLFLWLYLRNKL